MGTGNQFCGFLRIGIQESIFQSGDDELESLRWLNTEKREKIMSTLSKLKSGFCFHLKFAITSFCVRFRFGKKEKHGILLLRNDGLGDFLISIPLMMQIYDAAKKRGSTVTVVVSENMLDFASRCPFFDNIITIPLRNPMGNFLTRIAVLRQFAGIQAETVINLMVFGRCGIEDYIAYFTKAERKFVLENFNAFPVYPGIAEFRNRSKFIYSSILEYNPEKTLQENETALASAALGTKFLSVPANLDFLRPLPSPPLPDTGNYYLVIAGSANSHKNWDVKKFASIINVITEFRPDLHAVMTGSANDMKIVCKVTTDCTSRKNITDLCGKTTLLELIALVENARFIITNDTGALHIAAILRRKTFCVIGLGHWGAYAPNPLYNTVEYFHTECECARCNWLCRKETNPAVYPCVREIETDTVRNAVLKFLAENTGTSRNENLL